MKFICLFLLTTLSWDGYSMNDSLPFFNSHSQELQKKINKRFISLGNSYKPRTKHLNADGSAVYINNLIFEESPYLLQHAHNPVNWQAWSPDAFAQAKKENKLIFISIGYATCHWCHVMEHESFEDIEIAKYINKHFVAIKVDRERRSAIDSYYMTSVQMMTGHGGWPMSNFTAPDGKPFFGGTYYQPAQFLILLNRINEVWNKQQPELIKQSIDIDSAINKHLSQSIQVAKIDKSIFSKTTELLLSMHDELHGGFSSAPKFPQEPWLLYLLSQDNKEITKILEFSLQQMLQGGIYDQVGGGFHRYSVDNEWLAPHFEKMMYNQSQLSEVYTKAAVKFNNTEFKRLATEIIDYVLKEMTNDYGVFYSAGDADSEGEEGLFFTWTEKELLHILTDKEFAWLKDIYHFSKNGNFENRNILNLSESLQKTAIRLELPYSEIVKAIKEINKKLYKVRQTRIKPLVDDKIITSWNAQMIYSLVYAGQYFNQQDYIQAASKAMDYLYTKHRSHKNQLVRNSLNDKASKINAELEDYAWMITALIKLYDVTSDENIFDKAKALIIMCDNLFTDIKQGGYFDNIPEDNIPNTMRIKKSEDGATVSANGQLLIALARFYRRSGDLKVKEFYDKTLAHFSGKIAAHSLSHATMLRAKQIMDDGEYSNLVYTAMGNVKISSKINDNTIELRFNIKPKWHVNSNTIKLKSLLPISIESNSKLKFKYPKAEVSQLSFSDESLSTFSGEFIVSAEMTKEALFPIQLNIKLQACSDEICLAPNVVKIIGVKL